MTYRENINQYITDALKDNWENLALTDFDGASFQYRDVARKIAKLHILFDSIGIKSGDKIALCGKNSAQWAIAFFATVTYGAVAVPILHDFKPDNIHHLVSHSEARLLFTDAAVWENLDPDAISGLEGVLLISDFSILLSRDSRLDSSRHNLNLLFGEKYPERFTPDDISYFSPDADRLAIINYTSGSTGFSKGVMLTYGNLWSNLQFCIDGLRFLDPGDGLVCMLPLAHMFGLMVELLHPFVKGCHISFLTRTPSPHVIMNAFERVKPKLIVTVPLIIEKIIRTRVFPMLEKPMMKILLSLPIIDDKLLAKVKDKLTEVFGGNLQQIIIGGAGLNGDVEKFLRRIHFPFTVGYGMTECAPLIAYAPWQDQRPGSCGRIVDRMSMRIDSPDPEHQPGVLWVKGGNVMQGYYKNPEKTKEAFVQNPLNQAVPEQIYRTGDIVKYNEYGEIIYLSRKDFQIKHMGHRIELGEIETAVSSLEEITLCCCLYDEKRQKIVLFIEEALDKAFINEKISHLVPEYMLPNKVITVEKMPINANGKIDRVKLKEYIV